MPSRSVPPLGPWPRCSDPTPYPRPAVTRVVPLRHFHPAEAYHQNVLAHHARNPYIVVHDQQKLLRLR